MIMPQSTEDSINKLIENKFYSSKKFAEEIEKIAQTIKTCHTLMQLYSSVRRIVWTLNQFPS